MKQKILILKNLIEKSRNEKKYILHNYLFQKCLEIMHTKLYLTKTEKKYPPLDIVSIINFELIFLVFITSSNRVITLCQAQNVSSIKNSKNYLPTYNL